MKTFIRLFQLSAIFMVMLLSANVLVAQPLPPSPTSPLGGGLGFLAAAAFVWGYKKFKEQKK